MLKVGMSLDIWRSAGAIYYETFINLCESSHAHGAQVRRGTHTSTYVRYLSRYDCTASIRTDQELSLVSGR